MDRVGVLVIIRTFRQVAAARSSETVDSLLCFFPRATVRRAAFKEADLIVGGTSESAHCADDVTVSGWSGGYFATG